MIRIALIGVAAALPALATAQHAAEPKSPAPTAATPAAGAPRYESAFGGYRAWKDEPAEAWRDVNDRVGRVGGHAGALRAEAQPASSPAPAPAPASAPAAGGHRHDH